MWELLGQATRIWHIATQQLSCSEEPALKAAARIFGYWSSRQAWLVSALRAQHMQSMGADASAYDCGRSEPDLHACMLSSLLTLSHVYLLAHSLTCSLTHSLAHSLARSLFHLLSQACIHSLMPALTDACTLTHASTLTHLLTHSLTHI